MSAVRHIVPGDDTVRSLAEARVLLIVCDFDGTLSPIAPRPSDARTDAEAVETLRRLARLPRTYTSVLSGRSISELRDLVGPAHGVRLIGSHGAEPEGGGTEPAVGERERIDQLWSEVRRLFMTAAVR